LVDILKQVGASLLELYLHWNLLEGDFGLILANDVLNDFRNQLLVLDLSYNHLKNCGYQILHSQAGLEDKRLTLRHLDLSYNKFIYSELLEMQTLLKENRTIYGIHIEGNHDFYVDKQGFFANSNKSTQEYEIT
jgi:hypothetical protein